MNWKATGILALSESPEKNLNSASIIMKGKAGKKRKVKKGKKKNPEAQNKPWTNPDGKSDSVLPLQKFHNPAREACQ